MDIDIKPLQTDEVCLQGFIKHMQDTIDRITQTHNAEVKLLRQHIDTLQKACPHRLWVRIDVHSGLPRSACECCGMPGGFWCSDRPGGGPCVSPSEQSACIFCGEHLF